MTEDVRGKNGVIKVSRTVGRKDKGKTTSSEEMIEVQKFETNPATVSCALGMTLNLGNYESAKIEVFVSLPCYKEEIDEAFETAKGWCEKKVTEQIAEIKKG